jgi:hypothetical protein
MDDVPSPRDLRGVATISQALAYIIGVGGIVAGGFMQNDGNSGMAALLWLTGFGIGALLTVASFIVRALSGALARLEHLEAEVGLLTRARAAERWER